MLSSLPLAATAAALRSGRLDLFPFLEKLCATIEATEPAIHALLPEPNRRQRLLAGAVTLQLRFPHPQTRPPLYGIPFGVKDVFNADGFPTRAGSQLPAELFDGPAADCVTLLRKAGALVLGKTVSTEFAWFEPGPTRNPHNLEHTPGGSSSGSAAAVAANFCPLALGTQTIGSVIRPAAFCGAVGFKPTYGRIATGGLIPCAPSLDTVGFFTQDIDGIALVASILCTNWQPVQPQRLPVLGVADGPYLRQVSPEALASFETTLAQLEQTGYNVRRVPALQHIESIRQQHMTIVFAEMAQTHAQWFAQFEHLYRPRTISAIREGQHISPDTLEQCRADRFKLRAELESLMAQHAIDLWLSPAALGPAPEGIAATGNPIMNLPWTYAGMPALTFPVARAANGLPLGLQITAATTADEQLLSWAAVIADALPNIHADL